MVLYVRVCRSGHTPREIISVIKKARRSGLFFSKAVVIIQDLTWIIRPSRKP